MRQIKIKNKEFIIFIVSAVIILGVIAFYPYAETQKDREIVKQHVLQQRQINQTAVDIHNDIEQINTKLDLLFNHLNITLGDK